MGGDASFQAKDPFVEIHLENHRRRSSHATADKATGSTWEKINFISTAFPGFSRIFGNLPAFFRKKIHCQIDLENLPDFFDNFPIFLEEKSIVD